MGEFSVRCPAKINLHLEVLGRRGDGFHEVRTVVAPIGLWDEVTAATAPPGVLELAVEPLGVVPDGGENLIMRAARLLRQETGSTTGARLDLHKRIPVAAGLGGGSSDAAAALVALDALWGLELGSARLRSLAARLGSDVPAFLLGGVVWGVGRGSEVYRLPDLAPWWVVLLPGNEPVSTAAVYGSLTVADAAEGSTSVYDWVVDGGGLPLAVCRNDLESTVVGGWPDVARRLGELRRSRPMLAMVSGSGGTVFAVYDSEVRARQEARRLEAMHPLIAPLLPRRESLLVVSAGRTNGHH